MTSRSTLAHKPAWLPIEERKELRLPLAIDAVLIDSAGTRTMGRITDISGLGCRIASDAAMTVGRFLSIEVPGFTRYSGWVAWRVQGEFGLDFSHAVPADVIGHLVDRGNPDGI